MSTDEYGFIDVALVVRVRALREILRSLHVDGRDWWIGIDPERAREIGWITLGWGNQRCSDPLNVQYFLAPILKGAQDTRPDNLLVLFDASSIESEDRCCPNSVGDFQDFFVPLKTALIGRLQAQPVEEER